MLLLLLLTPLAYKPSIVGRRTSSLGIGGWLTIITGITIANYPS
jgi:hypothetical protein